MTWIFNNTKGSVLAVALFHATINTGVFALHLDWRYYVIELLVVILIVIIFGPKDLVRKQVVKHTEVVPSLNESSPRETPFVKIP
jgi:hypothetical protein